MKTVDILDNILLFSIFLLQGPVASVIKLGFDEVVVKPFAIRRTESAITALRAVVPAITQKSFDQLDKSLPLSVSNLIGFMAEPESYVKATVIPEIEAKVMKLGEDGQKALIDHLVTNWDKSSFLKKIKAV